ncbi:MAG: phage tail protein [Chloroflexi bacterium]|nr:phage tail protein [Chloroflexota bacterium]
MNNSGGVVTGIVKELKDPDKMGRIKVTFKWMSEEETLSNWARIAVPMAGGSRGTQFMPEEGDEVLLAFEHGSQRFPYIIGFLWNGEDKQPREEKLSVRTIQTVSGHYLEFDDTDKEEKISLKFKGETPSIVIDEKTVNIVTTDGHLVSVDDENKNISLKFGGESPSIVMEEGKITLKVGEDSSIVMEEKTIKIEADGSSIELTGDAITVSSTKIDLNP